MYDFWYDYIKPKYGENAKLCFMDTGIFIVHVKTKDIYKDIAEDLQIVKQTRRCLKEKKGKQINVRWIERTNHE